MIATGLLREWLDTLPADSYVAVNDDGLAIVHCTPEGKETETYIELGGVPLPECIECETPLDDWEQRDAHECENADGTPAGIICKGCWTAGGRQ